MQTALLGKTNRMLPTLAETGVSEQMVPSLIGAHVSLAGMAVVGGLAGVALTAKKDSAAWLYGGVAAGVLAGGAIGYLGAYYIMKRSFDKVRAQIAAEDLQRRLQSEGATTS